MAGASKPWSYQDLWGNDTETPKVKLARPARPEPPPAPPKPYDGPMDGQLSITDALG
jgi:hypothetical protein